MEIEDTEQEILLEPEAFADVGDGVLTIQKNGTDVGTFTANQKTDTTVNITVPVSTSELTNDANFQNANDVANAISTHNQSSSAHQDIRQAITDEATARGNADNALQGQIDAITSSSDVVDIVGTYAELQAYDTQHLQDNDVIKVLQDETHDDAMTYWRWNKTTSTWTYIGAEGPYYTKSEANTLLDGKLDKSTVPDGFFDGPATITPASGTSVELENALKLKSVDLYGDTTQQTYSGKNQFNIETFAQGSITVSDGVATGTTGQFYTEFSNGFTIANTSAVMSITATAYREGTSSSGNGIIFRAVYTDSTTENLLIFPNSTVSETTLTATTNTSKTLDKFEIIYGAGSSNVWHLSQIQIEAGTTPTTFEKFVGGTPSPNPDYPQTVNVVTGEQTITVTDGDVSQTYTVDLGTIELCKIGTYQDYIYKSGDDWYVHKEIENILVDGTQNMNFHNNRNNIDGYRLFFTSNIKASTQVYSERFIYQDWDNYQVNGNTRKYSVVSTALSDINNVYITFKDNTMATASDFQTWFSNNNTLFYYVLATPTDTQITDNTLIEQLNAVLNATMYSPTTTISSSGNLPAILKIVGFTEHLNSLLEIAAEPEQEPVTYDNFVGTDGVNAGTAGLVPAPATTDAGKFLKADGTWDTAGSSVNVVQSTGTSQTDVMSQNAVTAMIYKDGATAKRVAIGLSATTNKDDTFALGSSASVTAAGGYAFGKSAGASHQYSVAMGYQAKTTRIGEVNIGSGSYSAYGHNNTQYRLLGGVYDGEDAHDAVTVNQVNSVIDNINAALSTNISHIGS